MTTGYDNAKCAAVIAEALADAGLLDVEYHTTKSAKLAAIRVIFEILEKEKP